MLNKKKTILAISISTLMLLSACANKEVTFGEKLLSRGDDVHKIGEQWSEGENLTIEGNELVLSGRKDINTGETMISQGNMLKKNAEEDYKKKAEHPVLIR